MLWEDSFELKTSLIMRLNKVEGGTLKYQKNWGSSCSNNNWRLAGEHISLENLSLEIKTATWY